MDQKQFDQLLFYTTKVDDFSGPYFRKHRKNVKLDNTIKFEADVPAAKQGQIPENCYNYDKSNLNSKMKSSESGDYLKLDDQLYEEKFDKPVYVRLGRSLKSLTESEDKRNIFRRQLQ